MPNQPMYLHHKRQISCSRMGEIRTTRPGKRELARKREDGKREEAKKTLRKHLLRKEVKCGNVRPSEGKGRDQEINPVATIYGMQ